MSPLRLTLYFLLPALIILACGSTHSSEHVSSGTPPNGEALYKQYCVLCHGADGKKGFGGAGDLTASKLTVEERTVIIREGKGLMTPYKEMLDEAQIRALAEYTLRLKS